MLEFTQKFIDSSNNIMNISNSSQKDHKKDQNKAVFSKNTKFNIRMTNQASPPSLTYKNISPPRF